MVAKLRMIAVFNRRRAWDLSGTCTSRVVVKSEGSEHGEEEVQRVLGLSDKRLRDD